MRVLAFMLDSLHGIRRDFPLTSFSRVTSVFFGLLGILSSGGFWVGSWAFLVVSNRSVQWLQVTEAAPQLSTARWSVVVSSRIKSSQITNHRDSFIINVFIPRVRASCAFAIHLELN